MSTKLTATAAVAAAKIHESVGHEVYGRRNIMPGGQTVTVEFAGKFTPIAPATGGTTSGNDPKMSPVSFASSLADRGGHLSVGMGRTSPDLQGRITPPPQVKGMIGEAFAKVLEVAEKIGFQGAADMDPEWQRPPENGGRRSPANGNREFNGQEISDAGNVDRDRGDGDRDARVVLGRAFDVQAALNRWAY